MSTDGPGFSERVLEVMRRGDAEDVTRQARVGGQLKGIVGNATLDWSLMPPHLMCSWQMGTTFEHPLYGWLIPYDAAGATTIVGMRHAGRPLPARDGYTRQYRLFCRFAHSPGGSETAWRIQMRVDTAAINVLSTNVTTHAVDHSSGWVTSSVLDGWAAGGSDMPVGFAPVGGMDYADGAPSVTCRAALLEGRYV